MYCEKNGEYFLGHGKTGKQKARFRKNVLGGAVILFPAAVTAFLGVLIFNGVSNSGADHIQELFHSDENDIDSLDFSSCFPDEVSCIRKSRDDDKPLWWRLRSSQNDRDFDRIGINGRCESDNADKEGALLVAFVSERFDMKRIPDPYLLFEVEVRLVNT